MATKKPFSHSSVRWCTFGWVCLHGTEAFRLHKSCRYVCAERERSQIHRCVCKKEIRSRGESHHGVHPSPKSACHAKEEAWKIRWGGGIGAAAAQGKTEASLEESLASSLAGRRRRLQEGRPAPSPSFPPPLPLPLHPTTGLA